MKKQALNTLYHSVYNIHYHLVLATKYRRRCITPEVAAYLESQYKRLLKSWDCELLECNGEPDHLHLLISANPKMQPSKMVNSLKTATSDLCERSFPNTWVSFTGSQFFTAEVIVWLVAEVHHLKS